jgi:hypothetical protein
MMLRTSNKKNIKQKYNTDESRREPGREQWSKRGAQPCLGLSQSLPARHTPARWHTRQATAAQPRPQPSPRKQGFDWPEVELLFVEANRARMRKAPASFLAQGGRMTAPGLACAAPGKPVQASKLRLLSMDGSGSTKILGIKHRRRKTRADSPNSTTRDDCHGSLRFSKERLTNRLNYKPQNRLNE